MLSVLAFVAFGRDIFEHKEPTILFSKISTDNSTYLFDENFVMMWGIYYFSQPGQSALQIQEQEKKFKFMLQTINMDSSCIAKGIDAY